MTRGTRSAARASRLRPWAGACCCSTARRVTRSPPCWGGSDPRTRGGRDALDPGAHAPGIAPSQRTAGQLIHQRRSALAFDGKTSISAGGFFAMLARVVPRVDRDLCKRTMPWDVLPWETAIHLALFVHRVDGLASGLYMLVRDAGKLDPLRRATHPQY